MVGPRSSVREVLPLLLDQQRRARELLAPDVVAYFAGGAGAGRTLAEAERAWDDVRLLPRVLRDVAAVDTSLTLLGSVLRTPVLVAPTAAHGLAHPDAERATALGAARAGSLLVLSARATRSPEQVVAGPCWHQSYVLQDRELTWRAAEAAAGAGATAIVLTGDVPWLGARTAPARARLTGQVHALGDVQDPTATLSVVEELRRRTGLPVLVKGVLHPDDATECLDAGAAGVIVSNHGGRQLDRAVATAGALPGVVAAVAGRGPVLVDGGLRSGLDVLCALALGADAVLVGRPVLWALAAGGADGVQACLEALTRDLAHQLGLAGAADLAAVRRLVGTVPRA